MIKVLPAGEAGLYLVVGDTISVRTSDAVLGLARAVKELGLEGVREVVPGYASLFVEFDPGRWGPEQLAARLRALEPGIPSEPTSRRFHVAVRYGGEDGPDLNEISELLGLTAREVVRRHTAPEYTVLFLGFTPGFPFLGGMDPSIAVPRLATPRVLVAAGSVGIAGEQTGIYPLASPGGWRLIGRTDFRLFDPASPEVVTLRPGDRILFSEAGPAEVA